MDECLRQTVMVVIHKCLRIQGGSGLTFFGTGIVGSTRRNSWLLRNGYRTLLGRTSGTPFQGNAAI